MLTDTKLLYGPFDVELLATLVSKYARTGIVEGAMEMTVDTRLGERKLLNGKMVKYIEGRDLELVLTVNEIDPAIASDMEKVEDSDNMTVTFNDNSRVITINPIDKISINIADLKMEIRAFASVPTGSDIDELFVVPEGS